MAHVQDRVASGSAFFSESGLGGGLGSIFVGGVLCCVQIARFLAPLSERVKLVRIWAPGFFFAHLVRSERRKDSCTVDLGLTSVLSVLDVSLYA